MLENVTTLDYQNKKIILVATAHVSKESVELVKQVIEEERPDSYAHWCAISKRTGYLSFALRDILKLYPNLSLETFLQMEPWIIIQPTIY